MIELVPFERDKSAKNMYLFMRWFLRKNKKIIRENAERAMWDIVLYGDCAEEEWKSLLGGGR